MGMQLNLLRWLLPLGLLAGCAPDEAPYRETMSAFGNPVTFSVRGLPEQRARQAVAAAAADLKFIEEVSDPQRPGPLGRTNQMLAAAGEFSANPSLLPLIRRSQALSAQSGGRFNPALGGLRALWGFYNTPPGPVPSAAAIADLLAQHPGMDDILIDGILMRCTNPAVRLDFGDFGRGYALDMALARLREAGVHNGSLTTAGVAARLGQGAAVNVQFIGSDEKTVLATLTLQTQEVAYTVSAARGSYQQAGRRYPPILDPQSGYPVEEVVSVTVLHTQLAEAAAAATALFIAGPEHWTEVAHDMGIERAVLIDVENNIHITRALSSRLLMRESGTQPVIDE